MGYMEFMGAKNNGEEELISYVQSMCDSASYLGEEPEFCDSLTQFDHSSDSS